MLNIELKDTIVPMCSADYRDRFVAEYIQLKVRYERLKAFNTKIKAAVLSFGEEREVEEPRHECPAELLREQQKLMGELLHVLEVRAVIEGIDLDGCMKMLYDKAREREEDEAERITLSECEDDGEVLGEAFRRCIFSGVTTDEEDARIFEAATNLLLKVRGLYEPCKLGKAEEADLQDDTSSGRTVGDASPYTGEGLEEERPEGLMSFEDTLKAEKICNITGGKCVIDCPCYCERGCNFDLRLQSLSYHFKKICKV